MRSHSLTRTYTRQGCCCTARASMASFSSGQPFSQSRVSVLCERATRLRRRRPVSRALSGALFTHRTRHRQGSLAASRQLGQTEAEAQRLRTLSLLPVKCSKQSSSTLCGRSEKSAMLASAGLIRWARGVRRGGHRSPSSSVVASQKSTPRACIILTQRTSPAVACARYSRYLV